MLHGFWYATLNALSANDDYLMKSEIGVCINTMPELSVIIPCFNHAEYVENCIESVVKAYSGTLVIIFCDDASSDDSFEIAKKKLIEVSSRCPNRISYTAIRNKKNKGVCATLNSCVEKISTDYIYLIASDDYLLPGSLDCSVKEIIEKKLDVLINDCNVVDGEGVIRFESAIFDFRNGYKKAYEHGLLRDELIMNWVVPGPATLMRSSVFSRIGGYDTRLLAEDRDFYLRVLATLNFGFSPTPIACYRVHAKNVSRSKAYLSKIRREMADVNLKYAHNYTGLARLYLLAFYVDKLPFVHGLGRIIRGVIYRLFKLSITKKDYVMKMINK